MWRRNRNSYCSRVRGASGLGRWLIPQRRHRPPRSTSLAAGPPRNRGAGRSGRGRWPGRPPRLSRTCRCSRAGSSAGRGPAPGTSPSRAPGRHRTNDVCVAFPLWSPLLSCAARLQEPTPAAFLDPPVNGRYGYVVGLGDDDGRTAFCCCEVCVEPRYAPIERIGVGTIGRNREPEARPLLPRDLLVQRAGFPECTFMPRLKRLLVVRHPFREPRRNNGVVAVRLDLPNRQTAQVVTRDRAIGRRHVDLRDLPAPVFSLPNSNPCVPVKLRVVKPNDPVRAIDEVGEREFGHQVTVPFP